MGKLLLLMAGVELAILPFLLPPAPCLLTASPRSAARAQEKGEPELQVRYLNFCKKWVGFNRGFLLYFSYESSGSVPGTREICLAIGHFQSDKM